MLLVFHLRSGRTACAKTWKEPEKSPHMHRFTNVLIALTLATGLAACGGGYSGFIIPIESELKPWVAPEADELVADEEEEDYEDYEDYEDEEEDEEQKDAPAPVPVKPEPPK